MNGSVEPQLESSHWLSRSSEGTDSIPHTNPLLFREKELTRVLKHYEAG